MHNGVIRRHVAGLVLSGPVEAVDLEHRQDNGRAGREDEVHDVQNRREAEILLFPIRARAVPHN